MGEFDTITIIGFIAATLTTGAYIPQAVKTWKTRSAKDLSLRMFLMMTSGMSLWLVYGIFRKDPPIIIANAVALFFALIILYFKTKEQLMRKKP
jgi:MtN3 and saliva related transmembrane protein